LPPKVQLGLYLLLSFAVVVFIAVTVHMTWKDNLTGNRVVLATDYIKVLVLFLQYTVIIGSLSVAWPLFDVQRWFMAVNIVFAVGSGQALSLDCWLHHYLRSSKLPLAMQRQLVYFLSPVFVLLGVLTVQWLAWALVRWVVPLVWRPKEGATQQPASLVLRKLPVTLLVSAYYANPTLARAAISFLRACALIESRLRYSCRQVPPPLSTTQQATGLAISPSSALQGTTRDRRWGWVSLLSCCGALVSPLLWVWGCSCAGLRLTKTASVGTLDSFTAARGLSACGGRLFGLHALLCSR
jgi:hypothetical protein